MEFSFNNLFKCLIYSISSNISILIMYYGKYYSSSSSKFIRNEFEPWPEHLVMIIQPDDPASVIDVCDSFHRLNIKIALWDGFMPYMAVVDQETVTMVALLYPSAYIKTKPVRSFLGLINPLHSTTSTALNSAVRIWISSEDLPILPPDSQLMGETPYF